MTDEELAKRIAEGFKKGAEVDQTHRENAEAFDPEVHGGMDLSYMEDPANIDAHLKD